MADEEAPWEWEHAGFGKHRAPLDAKTYPMRIPKTFEDYAAELEAAQGEEDAKDHKETTARRKLMEEVAVQTAQYQLLQSKNARFLKAAKDYKYYELPRLYLIRPVMTEKVMKDLLSKNHDLLEITTQLVAKNEATAKLDSMALVDYAANE